ncbi:MAG: hypothetical protein ABIH84_01905 [bacterium]
MRINRPEYLEIKLATDLLLLILLLALLALPVASLGLSGVREGAQPQTAGASVERFR